MRHLITDVVFDLDDTLCDFSGARERGTKAAFESLPASLRSVGAELWKMIEPKLFRRFVDKEISRDDYRWLRFHDVLEELDALPPGAAKEQRLVDAMNASFMREINEGIQAVPGAKECIASLRRLGMRCHLLTNGPSDSQRRRIARLGLDPLLDHVFISEEIGAFKPDPAAFEAVLRWTGRAPQEIAMVGDDLENDILPARRAGLHAIHFARARSMYAPSIQRLSDLTQVVVEL